MDKVARAKARAYKPTEKNGIPWDTYQGILTGCALLYEPVIEEFIDGYVKRQRGHEPRHVVSPTGARIVQFWLPTNPVVVDITDHLRMEHGISNIVGHGLVKELIRLGRLKVALNQHPAFRDLGHDYAHVWVNERMKS